MTGLYWFDEEGTNDQNPTIFLSFPGTFTLSQDVTSKAIYGNIGYNVNDRMRVSGGLRVTEDDKDAFININDGLIDTSATDDFSDADMAEDPFMIA